MKLRLIVIAAVERQTSPIDLIATMGNLDYCLEAAQGFLESPPTIP
jgi:hypothetical protein